MRQSMENNCLIFLSYGWGDEEICLRICTKFDEDMGQSATRTGFRLEISRSVSINGRLKDECGRKMRPNFGFYYPVKILLLMS